MQIEVRTQAELDAAIARVSDDDLIVLQGDGTFVFRGSSSPTVVARESSSPTVEARGSSSPTVVARESSSPTVVARGSSSPRVVAWGSSSPRVEAWGSSSPRVVAWGSSSPRVEAWGSSSPTVVARGSSSPTVEAWGSSSPTVVARGSSSPTVVARESSSPTVEARGSSSPTVEAWGSSSPTVVARESSSPTVEAWGSSSPTVEAWGSSSPTVVARESSSPRGSTGRWSTVVGQVHDRATFDIPGAVMLEVPRLDTPELWCEYHGVSVLDGVATLFKAVDDEFRSSYGGFSYVPGSVPRAPDWDGGERECGGGLHFAPSPAVAHGFWMDATRFVACPVRLDEIALHPDGLYPSKVKAAGCAGPVWEVDRDGEPVAAAGSAA